MSLEKETKNKIIFIVVFFVVAFAAEFFYRQPLFDNSVKIAKALQKSFSSLIDFFKVFTNIGKIDYIFVLIVLYFFPISYCYSYFLVVVMCWHFGSIIKVFYGNGRPGYIDKSVNISNASGYGNPSGHSYRASCNFPALATLIINLWEIKIIPSIFIYIFVGIIVLFVNLSRVVLGAHSINQVIYGDTVGSLNIL